MRIIAVTETQRKAARIAGFMFLFLLVAAYLAEFFIRSNIINYNNSAKTVSNIIANEQLFRIGIVLDLIGGAGNALLAIALYVLLSPVSNGLALLAAFWRLGESVILGFITLASMVLLLLLSNNAFLRSFTSDQINAVSMLCINAQSSGYDIGLTFYSLGSTIFSYLLFKSRYIPNFISLWGIIGSVLALIGTILAILVPSFSVIKPGCYIPVGTFEIIVGIWLLLKGVK